MGYIKLYLLKIENFLITLTNTNKKEAEQEFIKFGERYKDIQEIIINILNFMENFVYIINQQYIIEYANPSLINKFGDSKNKKCYEYFNARSEKCHLCKMSEVLKGNIVRSEWFSNDLNRNYDVIESPLKKTDGTIAKLSILRDITYRNQFEKSTKVSEEKYRKAYAQVNLYKDIFAHDINNILQNIHSSVELSSLYLNNPEKLHTIKELYEIINEQVNRAKKLIKNIKKITEIDESEVELEKIEAKRELERAIEFLKASFPNRKINIQVKTSIKKFYINANNLLLDVFENILINAVRHNDKSNIKITIVIDKKVVEDKKFVKIEFKDNGLGISDYRKKGIFEKGTRKDQRSKGMGLGLSLVKKILDSFKGQIWVEDRIKGDYKKGSNFVLLLQETE